MPNNIQIRLPSVFLRRNLNNYKKTEIVSTSINTTDIDSATNASAIPSTTIANDVANTNVESNNNNRNDENNDSALENFYNLLANLYNNGLIDLNCPNGQTRGWIFNGRIPEFAECGCYREALWPNFLGIPAAWKAGAKVATFRLSKKARKLAIKLGLKNVITSLDNLVDTYYAALKLIKNSSCLRRKLPPVPPGHIRLFRGQGQGAEVVSFKDSLRLDVDTEISPTLFNKSDSAWWTSDEALALHFAEQQRIVGQAKSVPYYSQPSEVFYVDVPIDVARQASLKDSPSFKLLPGQRRIGSIVGDPYINGRLSFPPDEIMPLRRRNSSGEIIEVMGHPDFDTDVDLNPGIFSRERISESTYYLDSSANGTNILETM